MKWLLPILCLCSACETVVELDPPEYGAESSILSYFNPDSVWAAQIHQTIPIGQSLSTGAPVLDNATVTVWQEDQLIDRLAYSGVGDGWYISTSGQRPLANSAYRLVVEASGLPRAEANSTVPSMPRLSNTSVSLESGQSGGDGYQYVVRFQLEDGSGDNFYSFSTYFLWPYKLREGEGGSYETILLPMERRDPTWHCTYQDAMNPVQSDLDRGEERGEACGIGIMTDRLFRGEPRDFEYPVFLDPFDDASFGVFMVFVTSMSEEYFEFQRSLEDQNGGDPFSEPSQLYTNFSGGRGVFAGYSAGQWIIDLPAGQSPRVSGGP